MWGVSTIVPKVDRVERIAPYLVDDLAGIADWRDRLAWPVPMAQLSRIGDRVSRSVLSFLGSLDDELERQVAVVAAGSMVNAFMALTEATFVAQGEERSGMIVIGGPPELAALRNDGAPAVVTPDRHRGKGVFDVRPASCALLRGVARTATWTPWHRLPAALLSPEATAVSHNPILRHHARVSGKGVNFQLAANLVHAARRLARDGELPKGVAELPDKVAEALLPEAEGLGGPYPARLRRLFIARSRPTIERIAADVLALRSFANLPRNLWSGANGAYANRLLSAEARRRGGAVTGFDHGGVTAISQLVALTAIGELSTTSHFCVGTRDWAELLGATDALDLVRPFNRPTIVHAAGDPIFRRACIDGKPQAGARPRVLYIGHPFRGLRQFAIAGTPDVIYWDFHSRVAEHLKALDIDLVCKPHPEGYFVGRRNPIEDIAPTSYKRFEKHLRDTDVFVFDAPTSTTFSEALCTNRPVVLIDRGHYPFNPAVKPMVRTRCRIVPTRTNEANRIWFDPEELTEAVLGGPVKADPSYFRALLAGVEG